MTNLARNPNYQERIDPDPIVKSGTTKIGGAAIELTKNGDLHILYPGAQIDRQREHERIEHTSFQEGDQAYLKLVGGNSHDRSSEK